MDGTDYIPGTCGWKKSFDDVVSHFFLANQTPADENEIMPDFEFLLNILASGEIMCNVYVNRLYPF